MSNRKFFLNYFRVKRCRVETSPVSIFFYLVILTCTVKPGLTLLKTICHVDKIAQASAIPPASIIVPSIAKIVRTNHLSACSSEKVTGAAYRLTVAVRVQTRRGLGCTFALTRRIQNSINSTTEQTGRRQARDGRRRKRHANLLATPMVKQ